MNTTFDVKIKGLAELQRSFAASPEIVGHILEQAVARVPDILSKYTNGSTVPYRTGQLMQTFRRSVAGLTAKWGPTVRYAPFVEFGHKQEVGRYVPAIKRRLVQPFVKRNPFMERIRSAAKTDIDSTFKEAGDVIARALSTQP